jgi:hypothetical protein
MLTLANVEIDSSYVTYSFDCDFVADCDGSSIWEDTNGKKVRVTGISVTHNVYDDEFGTSVYVTHDSNWEIYTDRGFETAISKVLGFDVQFTEQGMQDDEYASLELA